MNTEYKPPFWVEDVRQAWRWFSMWVQGTGAAAMGAFLVLDESQRTALFLVVGLAPEEGVAWTAFITFLAGMLARVKKQ